jgi:hypothetical protein
VTSAVIADCWRCRWIPAGETQPKENLTMSKTIRGLLLAAGAAAAVGAVGTGVAVAAGPSSTTQTPAVTQSTTTAGQPATEKAGVEKADTEKAGAETDGPGGHADPAGNVDHQFDGNE